jgi:hypothetical protein
MLLKNGPLHFILRRRNSADVSMQSFVGIKNGLSPLKLSETFCFEDSIVLLGPQPYSAGKSPLDRSLVSSERPIRSALRLKLR